jgi:glutathione S-transferase
MVTLYWMSVSHPSQAVRRMLELKRVEFRTVNVLPLNQRVHLRLAGFRGGTVPAVKFHDATRVQGSRQIAKALDQRFPDPPLFPADPAGRARVEEAERWGDEQLQPVPRRIARYGALTNKDVRRWAADAQPFPGVGLLVHTSGPLIRYYGRTVEADGRRGNVEGVRSDLTELPGMLDHVDALLKDGTLTLEPPNAATLQILASVRSLLAFEDLRELVEPRACAEAARQVFPEFPGTLPRFLARDWLPA